MFNFFRNSLSLFLWILCSISYTSASAGHEITPPFDLSVAIRQPSQDGTDRLCDVNEGLDRKIPVITNQPTNRPRVYRPTCPYDPTSILNVLQLDGGGVRGAFSAQVLYKLEERINLDLTALEIELGGGPGPDRPLKELYEVFQGGITGTSTGSIIALGLTCPKHRGEDGAWEEGPYRPEQIVKFYKEMAPAVFKYWSFANCKENITDGYGHGCFSSLRKLLFDVSTCGGCFACLKNCYGLCGPRYSNHKLRIILEKYFGNMKLGESVVPVQTVTFDLGTNKPLYPSSYSNPEMRMVDAAVRVKVEEGVEAECVDGGLIDNSAAFAALGFAMEHIRKYKPQDISPRANDFMLCSIGTGMAIRGSQFNQLRRAGLIGWAKIVPEIAIPGKGQADEMSLKALYGAKEGSSKGKYFRIQIPLSTDQEAMDNPKIVKALISRASIEAAHSDSFNGVLAHYIGKIRAGQDAAFDGAAQDEIDALFQLQEGAIQPTVTGAEDEDLPGQSLRQTAPAHGPRDASRTPLSVSVV